MENDESISSGLVREGQEAVESLEKLIKAVEEGDLWGLSDQQAVAMVRVAKVLIAAVDRESTVWKSLVQSGSLGKLKSVMEKVVKQFTESSPDLNCKSYVFEKEALESRIRRCDQ
jgi:hypothetical protein